MTAGQTNDGAKCFHSEGERSTIDFHSIPPPRHQLAWPRKTRNFPALRRQKFSNQKASCCLGLRSERVERGKALEEEVSNLSRHITSGGWLPFVKVLLFPAQERRRTWKKVLPLLAMNARRWIFSAFGVCVSEGSEKRKLELLICLSHPLHGASSQFNLIRAARDWHKSSFSLSLFLFFSRQITEALSFLHYSGQVIHKNVCPSSILVTKKGTWKLAGFEFIGNTVGDEVLIIRFSVWFAKTTPLSLPHSSLPSRIAPQLQYRTLERCHETDAVEPVVCQPWSTRLSKMAQPNLDYMGKWSERTWSLKKRQTTTRRRNSNFDLRKFDLPHERADDRQTFHDARSHFTHDSSIDILPPDNQTYSG